MRCSPLSPGPVSRLIRPIASIDLAIDFCEDAWPLDEQAIAQIVAILKEGGATVKVSSIHVNALFGCYGQADHDKEFCA